MLPGEKIAAGKGEIKADLALRNCRIVNVNTKEVHKGDIAIYSGFIVGIGDVDYLTGTGTKLIDVNNAHVCPGLIDGHVHFESSMVTLTQFAKLSLDVFVTISSCVPSSHLETSGAKLGVIDIKKFLDKKLIELHTAIRRMGCSLEAPFIQMSFLALPVIPSLKITDMGLVDVEEGKIIEVVEK